MMGGLSGKEIPLGFDTPFAPLSQPQSQSLPQFFTFFLLLSRGLNFSSTHECNGFTMIPWILFSVTRKFAFLLVLQFYYHLSHLCLQGFHGITHIHIVHLILSNLASSLLNLPLVSTMKVLNNSSTDGFLSAIG